MTPVRLAVIGAGHLGRFHSRLASASDRYDLVAVCDPSEAARNALAEETGARPVADYREVLDQVDAAVLATPTVTHNAIGCQLLSAGLHCLIEKPLAPTAAEATELVELADERNLVLQVGHVERFNPALELVQPQLRDPKYITATRTSGYTFRSTDIGAVLDIMIHDIDLVLGIAQSQVANVTAMGLSVLGDHEDMATAQITFESGCVAQLTASRVSYELQRTMQVFTSRGFVAVDFNSREATTVEPKEEVLRREFAAGELTNDQRDTLRSGLFEKLLVKSTSEAPPVNAIEAEQAEFADAIQTGSTPRVTGVVGREAVAVAELVLEAIEEHAWDGDAAGRRGAFATPALPILTTSQFDGLRKAG
ncbi:MAG: Gfo/Idh/MocA family oxidoreductase [Planctomycetota bacterium]